jgi:hypothetical protein
VECEVWSKILKVLWRDEKESVFILKKYINATSSYGNQAIEK